MGETHEIPHHNLADFEPWLGYATEGQAVGGIPFENTLEGPQFRPQPQTIAFCGGKSPSCYGRKGKGGSSKGKAQGH